MKRYLLLIGFILFLSGMGNNAHSQYYFYNDNYYYSPITYEIGASVGLMNSMTDLGGKGGAGKKFIKDLNMGNNNPAFGISAGVNFKSAFALRFDATFGKVSASDADLKKYANFNDIASARYYRNLSFESSIKEYSILAEAHPLFIFFNWEESENGPPKYSPYVVGGIGQFEFNPKANYKGALVELRPLCTEGQGILPNVPTYNLKQMNYQLGFGMKYEVSALLSVKAELLYRKLGTDYLDDVSTNYVVDAVQARDINGALIPDIYDNYFGLNTPKAALARALANRQAEIDPPTIDNPKGSFYDMNAGSIRGNSDNNDSYFTFSFKVLLTLGRERIRD